MIARHPIARIVIGAAAGLLVVVLAGLFVFAAFVTRPLSSAEPVADGVVALTGGGKRIRVAADLLKRGHAKRLLVSGVNRITTPRDLRKLTGLPRASFECCVDIGYDALDTEGNARETRDWVVSRGYRSLIVVTASYHMPRSLVELSRMLPGVVLHPHPVAARDADDGPWFLDPTLSRTLIAEYLKFLPAAGRYVLSMTFEGAPSDLPTVPASPAPVSARLDNG